MPQIIAKKKLATKNITFDSVIEVKDPSDKLG